MIRESDLLFGPPCISSFVAQYKGTQTSKGDTQNRF